LPLYSEMIDPIRKHNTFGFFVVKPEYQKKYQLLNANMGGIVWSKPYNASTESDKQFLDMAKIKNHSNIKRKPLLLRECDINIEQEPNIESIVSLQKQVDRFGDRKLKVEAKITELQHYTAVKSFSLFGQELARNSKGRVKIETSEKKLFDSILPSLGSHHMGTTRMSNDEKNGVVDKNCKIFGIDNLFVAGSSVFATGSCVNPTYTIVALAIRLADHLKLITK
jgi:choline dehydrogenase-like flavoprotein